jgi:hypothetical protein
MEGQEMLLVSGGIGVNKQILSSVEVFRGTDWEIDESLTLPLAGRNQCSSFTNSLFQKYFYKL